MFSFGFETRIKANWPLVNRLINDTWVNAYNHVSIRRRFKSDKRVLSFNRWDILVCIFLLKSMT